MNACTDSIFFILLLSYLIVQTILSLATLLEAVSSLVLFLAVLRSLCCSDAAHSAASLVLLKAAPPL